MLQQQAAVIFIVACICNIVAMFVIVFVGTITENSYNCYVEILRIDWDNSSLIIPFNLPRGSTLQCHRCECVRFTSYAGEMCFRVCCAS